MKCNRSKDYSGRTVDVKGIELVPEVYNIEGHDVDAVTCVRKSKSMAFYHFTDEKNLKKILESGVLKPISEGIYGIHSGSVSFSANPEHTYGSGNIKMTFIPAIGDILKPMRYYDYTAEREKGVPFDKIEKINREKYHLGLNELSTFLGATIDIYINECEWYTRSEVKIADFLESVTFMIPWSMEEFRFGIPNVSCKKVLHPKHSRIETYGCDFTCLQNKILDVGKTVREHGYTFFVDSCFPYIKDDIYRPDSNEPWGPYIVLDEKNLQRLAQGRKVVRKMPTEEEFKNLEDKCKC